MNITKGSSLVKATKHPARFGSGLALAKHLASSGGELTLPRLLADVGGASALGEDFSKSWWWICFRYQRKVPGGPRCLHPC